MAFRFPHLVDVRVNLKVVRVDEHEPCDALAFFRAGRRGGMACTSALGAAWIAACRGSAGRVATPEFDGSACRVREGEFVLSIQRGSDGDRLRARDRYERLTLVVARGGTEAEQVEHIVIEIRGIRAIVFDARVSHV